MDFKRLKIIVSHQAFLNLHNEFEALLQESQEPTEILHLLHVGKGTGYLYELLRLKMSTVLLFIYLSILPIIWML